MQRHLNYSEASALLGIRTATLYSLVHHKRIPHVRLGKRLVRFPEEELRRWLESQLVQPASPASGRR
jgi:excisionase family DNA binding protein